MLWWLAAGAVAADLDALRELAAVAPVAVEVTASVAEAGSESTSVMLTVKRVYRGTLPPLVATGDVSAEPASDWELVDGSRWLVLGAWDGNVLRPAPCAPLARVALDGNQATPGDGAARDAATLRSAVQAAVIYTRHDEGRSLDALCAE